MNARARNTVFTPLAALLFPNEAGICAKRQTPPATLDAMPALPPANLTFGIAPPSTAGNQGTNAPTAANLLMAAGPHFRLLHPPQL